MKLDLQKFLLNIFLEDKTKNKKHTIVSQLSMITIKSLMPSSTFIGNIIDYKRFKEELSLLKYYKIDEEKCFLTDIDEKIYFKYKDKTIYTRILPLILSNKDYDVIEEEVIKNILYTTGDIESLLEWLAISRCIFLIIEEEENILDNLKQYVINISQREFLTKYKNLYLYDVLKSDINFEVNFERIRVSLISLLHGVSIGKFKYLQDILKVLNGEDAQRSIGNIIENASIGKEIDYDIEDSYKRISIYVMKLRKSRINPDDLRIKEYILPDVFKFKEGEVFFHSLLNRSKVIKKQVKDDSLTCYIKTRAGMYLFKRDPFN
ncbi:hypothetical protein [Tissierella creatinophila]|uniref:hypothetical protein n=1 Tax=Tissierella creatinophila TaxID=79681 RepID=UPI0009514247|nr:hypothetical protein [Tissierella creatinophila]